MDGNEERTTDERKFKYLQTGTEFHRLYTTNYVQMLQVKVLFMHRSKIRCARSPVYIKNYVNTVPLSADEAF